MISHHAGDTLSVAAAGALAILVAVALPTTPVRSAMPAHAETLAAMEPAPTDAAPVLVRDTVPATGGNAGVTGGGCGEREIRVFDAAAGEYRTRTASVCWRNIL